MNSSQTTSPQTQLRDGEWEWLNRPGRFRVGGVTRDTARKATADRTQRQSTGK